MMEEPLSIRQAARLLGLRKGTLYNLTSRKEIPHYKVGNRIFFRETDLRTWFEGKRIRTNQEADHEYVKGLAKKILAENVGR